MVKQSSFRSSVIALSSLAYFYSPALAAETAPTYSWMLPRTVIDATIVYTFVSCGNEDGQGERLKIKITPILVARAIPDTLLKRRKIDTDQLVSFWQDRNISITTFSGSHILNSIGSNPVDQTAQIIGNIIGGVAKLVGVAFPGVGAAAAAVSNCAEDPTKDIAAYKKTIHDLELELSKGPEEAVQKRDTTQIQALQTLMADAQSKLKLTIKATIDPGYSNIKQTNIDDDAPVVSPPKTPTPIDKTGLIATFAPTLNELKKLKWFVDPSKEVGNPLLQVKVYLDFANALVPISPTAKGYEQTPVGVGDIKYRDVAYIPLLVWRGDRATPPVPGGDPLNQPMQLTPPQRVAFGQYGIEETVPTTTDTFKNLSWSITFLENGDVTTATFASKSTGVTLTGLFGNAASSTGTLATAAIGTASPSGQANAIEGQADLIYQTQRLALCEADPSSCPSK